MSRRHKKKRRNRRAREDGTPTKAWTIQGVPSSNPPPAALSAAAPVTPVPLPPGTNEPGLVGVLLDVPFPLVTPNASFLVHDPVKGVAALTIGQREGSRCFFRDRPIQGPTSFETLRRAAEPLSRPREKRSYVMTNVTRDGAEHASLNVNTGSDGGFAECKFYSEVSVTYLADDLAAALEGGASMRRVGEILNPFLDKYRILTGDPRIGHVSHDSNFYFAVSHTSPLAPEEVGRPAAELFQSLTRGRDFRTVLGHGSANTLRLNSLEALISTPPLAFTKEGFDWFSEFIQDPYVPLLSYELVFEALRALQVTRDYRLAIIHAQTACEVHTIHRLLGLMALEGITEAEVLRRLEDEQNFRGPKNRIRRLEELTERLEASRGRVFQPLLGTALYQRWESDLYDKRNSAVHRGVRTFTYPEASAAVGAAKEFIRFIEGRLPELADKVQLDPSMTPYRESAGGIAF